MVKFFISNSIVNYVIAMTMFFSILATSLQVMVPCMLYMNTSFGPHLEFSEVSFCKVGTSSLPVFSYHFSAMIYPFRARVGDNLFVNILPIGNVRTHGLYQFLCG